jgi:UDP-N-acetylmuramate dehydrogenase
MIVHENFQLSEVLWYKIGGKARYLLQCSNRDDLVEALDFIKDKKPKRIFICGQGTNLVFTDDYFDGAVIQIVSKPGESTLRVQGNQVTAFAGVILGDVIAFALDNQLIGLEWAGGLPGTVGAAVRGNVGAYGGEIKDSLISAEILDYSGEEPELKTLTNADLQFVYRGSLIKTHKKMLVVSATFGLKKSTEEETSAAQLVCEQNKQNRRDKHPLEYPNCGSVFKNLRRPEEIEKVLSVFPDLRDHVEKKWYGKVAVAPLIEKFGLKGYKVGNAQISEKHALFIINRGGAKAADVKQIIGHVKDTFQKKFGFEPEVEVEIVE